MTTMHHRALRGFRPVRNVDAGALLELVLVYAVAAILCIRVYLEVTGYPQVGGKGLHIAHMLWGGLLMLIALVIVIAFLGKSMVRLGAIVGGLGFGIFLDELGKFITSDNNYFYRPTFAVMYVIFVCLFLIFRAIDRRKQLTQEEALINAVDILQEVVRHDLDKKEKQQALQLLAQSDQSNAIVVALEQMLAEATPVADKMPDAPDRLMRRVRHWYYSVIGRSWFPTALIVIFTLLALGDLASLFGTVIADTRFTPLDPHLNFLDWADLLSSFTFAALVVVGITRLRHSRLAAYHWFRWAMLVTIFFGQVLAFYTDQLVAIVDLAFCLLLLGALNYTIGEEQAGADRVPVATSTPLLGSAGA